MESFIDKNPNYAYKLDNDLENFLQQQILECFPHIDQISAYQKIKFIIENHAKRIHFLSLHTCDQSYGLDTMFLNFIVQNYYWGKA